MIDKIGIGNGACLLRVEAFNNSTDNSAAGGMGKFMGLLIVTSVLEAGVTVAAGQMH